MMCRAEGPCIPCRCQLSHSGMVAQPSGLLLGDTGLDELAALVASWPPWPGGAAKPLWPHIFLLVPPALETGCAPAGLDCCDHLGCSESGGCHYPWAFLGTDNSTFPTHLSNSVSPVLVMFSQSPPSFPTCPDHPWLH